jgi:hypothetical protein
MAGLIDYSWYNIKNTPNGHEIYQMVIKCIYQTVVMAIHYTIIFLSMALHNIPKFGFFVCKIPFGNPAGE